MTASIFANLPNDIIMNIIKMAEDERKKDEEAREQHEDLFFYVDSELSEYFIKRQAQYENIGVGCCNIVKVKDAEYYSPKQVLSFLRDRYYEEESIETFRERSSEEDFNNPPEDAYDWGDEPQWA